MLQWVTQQLFIIVHLHVILRVVDIDVLNRGQVDGGGREESS
jgi:hypothetical protein